MVCWDVEGHGCLGFHMGGINISGRIKQSLYPRTRHGELKVISMIYAPPYLMRRSVPKVTSIDHELATSPMLTPRHTRRQPLEIKQRLHTITTEETRTSINNKATRYNALRHRNYR